MYTGEPVLTEKAAEWGLVNDVVPVEAFMDRVMEFAETVAMRSRRTAARLKDAVYRGIEKTLDEGLEIECAHLVEILKSDDYKEGLTAFAGRRQPVFD
jgi:enoyl-CoA hydratase/carnithine racemase